MDIGATISRSFSIVFRHRALWVLGFLASLLGGISATGNLLNVPATAPGSFGELSPETERFLEQLTTDPGLILGALAGLLCVILLISLAFLVISTIAQGGLIAGVQQIEEEGGTTFGRAWSVGARKFWALFGLGVLLSLPILVLFVLFFVLFGGSLIPVIAATASGDDSASAAAASGIALLCGSGVLACVGLLYSIIAAALQTFGERAIVLEDRGVIEAIGRGWYVFRSNLGNVILLALILFVIGLVVGFVATILTGLLFAPTLVAAIVSASNEGGIGTGTLILGVANFLVVVIVSAIINAILTAFRSAAWTLAYRQFTSTSNIFATTTLPGPLPTA